MHRAQERWIRYVATFGVAVALVAVLAWGVVGPDAEQQPIEGWAGVYDEVSPSVLLVQVEVPEPRVGTAFAVGPGEALTARHLVLGADDVTLVDTNGRGWVARVLGTDARTDLALLIVEGASLPPVRFAEAAGPRVGDPVAAIGNPFGLGHSLTTGVVAHLGGRLAPGADGPRVDFVQLSIPLNPGNSGGPVFDRNGRVIGVLAGTHFQGQAIAFAVPGAVAVADLEALRQGAHVSRAFLGLHAVRVGDALVVDSVVASGPADRAGVRPGDVLTAVAGEAVATPEALTAMLDRLPGGAPIAIRILRDGQLVVVDVVLGDWADQPVVVAGMTLRAAPGSGGEVVAVRPRSRAERAGVQVGDVVQRVAGLPVQAPVDVREALTSGAPATIEIVRDGVSMPAQLE